MGLPMDEYDNDHTIKVQCLRCHWSNKISISQQLEEKVCLAFTSIMEEEHSLVTRLLCLHCRHWWAEYHQVYSIPRESGFRSSEAWRVLRVPRAWLWVYKRSLKSILNTSNLLQSGKFENLILTQGILIECCTDGGVS